MVCAAAINDKNMYFSNLGARVRVRLKTFCGTKGQDGITGVYDSKMGTYSFYLQFRVQNPNPNPVFEPYYFTLNF